MRRTVPAYLTPLALILALLVACGGGAATTAPQASTAPSTGASATSASTGTTSGGTTVTRAATGAATVTRAAPPAATRAASPGAATPAPRVTGALTIFAASSLTDAFNEMKGRIEAANPGTTITFNYAASSALRTQLEQGAKADLYASADTVQLDNAIKSGVINGSGSLFVRNTPVIIVPTNNPKGIATPADLARPGVKLVLAAPAVPIGNYSRQIIDKMSKDPAYGADFGPKARANVVSEEANVRQVVSKIQLGEGDAGIVYSSDVTPAVRDQVKIISIPAPVNVVAEYPIALVKGGANEAGARAFIDYLLSAEGQAILQKWGFLSVSR
jgi:molybdate transport system substrate-binding protein